MKAKYFLLGALMLICFSMKVRAQEPKPIFLTFKPQSFLMGANIGIDAATSERVSVFGEFTQQVIEFNTSALTVGAKYYFTGRPGKGFYGRVKSVSGFFYGRTPFENHPYYAGAGLGAGYMRPFGNSGKWHFAFDTGLKFVAPFGTRKNSSWEEEFGMAYYTVLSPASVIDLNFSIAYRF